jgi:hypothetical protein
MAGPLTRRSCGDSGVSESFRERSLVICGILGASAPPARDFGRGEPSADKRQVVGRHPAEVVVTHTSGPKS